MKSTSSATQVLRAAQARAGQPDARALRPIRRGRAATAQPKPRFAKENSETEFGDWYLAPEDLPSTQVPTRVFKERARSIITRNQSPDVPFDQSINMYRGCEHGCIYCYARPSHSYVDLSPGLDFETKLFAKTNAAKVLARELDARDYECSPINLGANTDPYQPIEAKHKITRQILETLDANDHPVTIITKSALILRDADILERMAQRNLVSVAISITTLDKPLKRLLEPRAASAQARLKVMKELSQRGIPTTLLMAPIIPAINDHEVEAVVAAAARAGAKSAHYIFLRLPFEVKDLFTDWLIEHYPMRARHVMNLIGDARDGRANETKFGKRMSGNGPYAMMINKRFAKSCREHGLVAREDTELNTQLFEQQRPGNAQMSLL